MTTAHIVPGHVPCPYLECPDKAAGKPHWHYFALGETKTAYPKEPIVTSVIKSLVSDSDDDKYLDWAAARAAGATVEEADRAMGETLASRSPFTSPSATRELDSATERIADDFGVGLTIESLRRYALRRAADNAGNAMQEYWTTLAARLATATVGYVKAMRHCGPRCRGARVVRPERCRCICEGAYHGTEVQPRLLEVKRSDKPDRNKQEPRHPVRDQRPGAGRTAPLRAAGEPAGVDRRGRGVADERPEDPGAAAPPA